MLGQRHGRWPNIKPTLILCLVFAWSLLHSSAKQNVVTGYNLREQLL